MILMLKKLTSLLLSLLVCLSIIPGQAHAGDLPERSDPPAQVEPLGTEAPDELEPPVMPDSAENVPEIGGEDYGKG